MNEPGLSLEDTKEVNGCIDQLMDLLIEWKSDNIEGENQFLALTATLAEFGLRGGLSKLQVMKFFGDVCDQAIENHKD